MKKPSNKLKQGDKVKFSFAGSSYVGVFENIKVVEYGTIKRTYYQCRGEDSTLYPLDKENIQKL